MGEKHFNKSVMLQMMLCDNGELFLIFFKTKEMTCNRKQKLV